MEGDQKHMDVNPMLYLQLIIYNLRWWIIFALELLVSLELACMIKSLNHTFRDGLDVSSDFELAIMIKTKCLDTLNVTPSQTQWVIAFSHMEWCIAIL